jgi:hypothetical protein
MTSSVRLVSVVEAEDSVDEMIWFRQRDTEMKMTGIEDSMAWCLTYRTIMIVDGNVVGVEVEMVATPVEILGDGGQGLLAQGGTETAGETMIVDVDRLVSLW